MPGLASDPFGQWLLVVQHELESDSQITAIMLLRSTKWYGDPVEPHRTLWRLAWSWPRQADRQVVDVRQHAQWPMR
jgi:hypothetical protein